MIPKIVFFFCFAYKWDENMYGIPEKLGFSFTESYHRGWLHDIQAALKDA